MPTIAVVTLVNKQYPDALMRYRSYPPSGAGLLLLATCAAFVFFDTNMCVFTWRVSFLHCVFSLGVHILSFDINMCSACLYRPVCQKEPAQAPPAQQGQLPITKNNPSQP